MIVTLAGHVDHGKTSLVQALSGVNTDRLAEEQARGLTIDLGFAYINDGAIGFVDVPGHHKFIHNMVAGVAAHQHALLVIAADDGPMPQSREHLQILGLAGLGSGVVALTKVDRVAPERVVEAEGAIRSLTANTFLEGAPIIRTSSHDGTGIAELLEHLQTQAATRQLEAGNSNNFRLAVDRAFNVRGAGLVVTGTAHHGTVAEGDLLTFFPSGKSVRVRSLHAQDRKVASAHAGERVALNVAGADLHDVERGHWLTSLPGKGTTHLTMSLDVLDDFPRDIKHWTPVHLYHATSHTTGRVALLSTDPISPGNNGLIDVVCDAPLLVQRGDRLILRDQSLDRTLGGGELVYAQDTLSRRRRDPHRIAGIAPYRADTAADCLQGLLTEGVVNLHEFASIWGLSDPTLEQLTSVHNGERVAEFLIDKKHWQAWGNHVVTALTAHARSAPDSQGMKENELLTDTPIRKVVRSALLQSLVAAGSVATTAGFFHIPRHKASLTPELAKLMESLEPFLAKKQAPSLGDLAKTLSRPLPALTREMQQIARQGELVQIADKRFYSPGMLAELAQDAANLAEKAPFTVREFRDTTGVGRNVAIEVLEHFDKKGYTLRSGDTRKVARAWR